jgi:poly-gamma-glutamate capsule biosynthesis protein CapA/YwtB (metallophosphatase superfamily)
MMILLQRSEKKAVVIILIVTATLLAYVSLFHTSTQPVQEPHEIVTITNRITLLAFGDINLGRMIGQRIINGDIDFPFGKIDFSKDSADIIFANLESQISDQKGETVSPLSNVVFTAPPEAALSLRNAGITIVSTANNHAFDYGMNAAYETLDHLTKQNILFVGTSHNQQNVFQPLIVEEKTIKIAIFAVTEFVNFNPKGWQTVAAAIDTVQLWSEITKIRDSVDVIIMSCHGGDEYTTRPTTTIRQFAEWCAAHGVDIFLGHHPHVTHGVDTASGKIIVHSLGNFVFYQPQHYWTQRSYGIKFIIEKTDSTVRCKIEKFIPLDVGFQTRRLTDTAEIRKLKARTQHLSNFDLTPFWE